MSDLLRDTAFGHLLRFVTGKRILKYEEETSASLCLRYADDATGGRSTVPLPSEHEKDESLSSTAASLKQSGTPNAVNGQNDSIAPTSIEKAELAHDNNLVDWYGPNDPGQSRNLHLAIQSLVDENYSQSHELVNSEEVLRHCTGTVMRGRMIPEQLLTSHNQICLLTVSIYSGSSIYAPAIPSLAETFGVSNVAAVLGLTLFVLGYGLGPMLWSPMSEVPYIGRTPVYLFTLVVFVALQGPTARASSFGMLMVFRFLTGFFGSPVLATGGATCADMYVPAKRAYAISIWGIAAVCGPALGPVLGGYVTEYGKLDSTFRAHWQWPVSPSALIFARARS